MSDAYDEIAVRVPVVTAGSVPARTVILRDRPEIYMGPDGHDREVFVAIGRGQHPLYLLPEEAEALAAALEGWRARRAALRGQAPVEEARR